MVLAVIGAAICLIIALSSGGGEKPKSAADAAHDLRVDAWVMAQGFVEDRLKSPATANFPQRSEETVTSLGSDQYLVVGYVDAQNSFGALVRSDFVCKLQRSGDQWTLVSLDMAQR